MRPAAATAPLSYLFAIAVGATVVGTSFLVKPAATMWVVFSVGVVMTLTSLAAAARPVRT